MLVTLIKKAGHRVYLVNEYNTSQRLYETGEQLIKCRGDKCRTLLSLEMLTTKPCSKLSIH